MHISLLSLEEWPTGIFEDPVLKSTNDAYLYAKLIWNSVERQGFLVDLRSRLQKACVILLNDKNPDFDLCSCLACLSQFYRECLEECARIKEDHA